MLKGLAILLSAVILFLLCACNGFHGNNESKRKFRCSRKYRSTSGDSKNLRMTKVLATCLLGMGQNRDSRLRLEDFMQNSPAKCNG